MYKHKIMGYTDNCYVLLDDEGKPVVTKVYE